MTQPVVVFVHPDGAEQTVSVRRAGDTAMDAALDNGVAGILAQCGGGCTCATCHCYVDEAWLERLPAPHAGELDLLEYLPTRRPTSRLSCQIVMSPALSGLRLLIPAAQV